MSDSHRVFVSDGVRGGRGFSRGVRRAVLSLAEVLFARETGAPPAGRLLWLVDDLDDFFAHAGMRSRAVFLACLTTIELVAPLMLGRLCRFSNLSMADRFNSLRRFEESSLGLAFFGAKAALCIVWYEHPEAAREVGFDALSLSEPT